MCISGRDVSRHEEINPRDVGFSEWIIALPPLGAFKRPLYVDND